MGDKRCPLSMSSEEADNEVPTELLETINIFCSVWTWPVEVAPVEVAGALGVGDRDGYAGFYEIAKILEKFRKNSIVCFQK